MPAELLSVTVTQFGEKIQKRIIVATVGELKAALAEIPDAQPIVGPLGDEIEMT